MKLLFLGTWEIILIVLVVLLLFGGKKIPELMKGVGKGVKSFKDGMNGIEDAANTSNNNTSKSPETKQDGSQPEV
jgi:sec-independent protein translocase protein TatA